MWGKDGEQGAGPVTTCTRCRVGLGWVQPSRRVGQSVMGCALNVNGSGKATRVSWTPDSAGSRYRVPQHEPRHPMRPISLSRWLQCRWYLSKRSRVTEADKYRFCALPASLQVVSHRL